MAGCYVEHRTINAGTSITWDIAHHLYTRQLRGIAVVASDKPESLLAALTKQWYKIMRQTERQRASTLSAERIMELTHEVAAMKRMRFVVGSIGERQNAEVILTQCSEITWLPPDCHTLYITCKLNKKTMASLAQLMPPYGLIVVYS